MVASPSRIRPLRLAVTDVSTPQVPIADSQHPFPARRAKFMPRCITQRGATAVVSISIAAMRPQTMTDRDMPLPPFRARTAHIMQLGSIRIGQRARDQSPQFGGSTAELLNTADLRKNHCEVGYCK